MIQGGEELFTAMTIFVVAMIGFDILHMPSGVGSLMAICIAGVITIVGLYGD